MNDPEDFQGLYMEPDLPEGHKSGFVAVLGQPNVGKSTLMNQFLGEKLAIVTPRPQTTRTRQLGILTRNDVQVIFVDTPGMHRARNALGEYMVDTVEMTLPDNDVLLILVDATFPPREQDEDLAEQVRARAGEGQVALVLNKMDLVASDAEHLDQYRALYPQAAVFEVSALEGEGTDDLLAWIVEQLPEGPRFYPAEQLTQTRLRDNVAEVIREKMLLLYDEEIPHASAVVVDEFKERDHNMTYVGATIYVEKSSQKGIVIGKGGATIKRLNQEARPDIAEIVGTRVYLDLWVKVLKNWRKDENALRRLGYWRK